MAPLCCEPGADSKMSSTIPVLERWLLAGQAIGGVAVGVAWLLASAEGWPGIALALLALGLITGVAAFAALGNSFRVAPSPHRDAQLVRHGIYRWLRHPMYVAVVFVLAAAACSRPAVSVLVATGLNFVFYLAKARYEERVLMHHYPDYEDYRTRTVGVRPLPQSPESGMESCRSRNDDA